jgi:hypothetical protein
MITVRGFKLISFGNQLDTVCEMKNILAGLVVILAISAYPFAKLTENEHLLFLVSPFFAFYIILSEIKTELRADMLEKR